MYLQNESVVSAAPRCDESQPSGEAKRTTESTGQQQVEPPAHPHHRHREPRAEWRVMMSPDMRRGWCDELIFGG